MTAFITEFYPWFLPTFLNYGKQINQADAVRPFILQKLGGVYLDLDTQCIRPMDVSLQDGYDAIFQVILFTFCRPPTSGSNNDGGSILLTKAV